MQKQFLQQQKDRLLKSVRKIWVSRLDCCVCLYLFDHKDLFSRGHYLLFFETTMHSRNVPMVELFTSWPQWVPHILVLPVFLDLLEMSQKTRKRNIINNLLILSAQSRLLPNGLVSLLMPYWFQLQNNCFDNKYLWNCSDAAADIILTNK